MSVASRGRVRRRCFQSVGFVFFLSPFSSEAQVSLQDAIAYAHLHSPRVSTARQTQELRGLEYKNSVAKLLPSVDLTAVHGLQNNIPINSNYTLFTPNASSPWISSLNLGLTETLYDNGVSLNQTRVTKMAQELADVAFQKARDLLTLDVMKEFYQFSLLDALARLKEQQRATLHKQFSTLSHQYKQGLKTKLDFLRFKAQLQRTEIDVLHALKDQASSSVALQRLLGRGEEEAPLSFIPVEVSHPQKEEALFPKDVPALEQVYDYKLAQIQGEINNSEVRLAVRRYWPQVFLTGGVNYSNFNYVNSVSPFAAGSQLSWTLLLTLEYNFWDWGVRRRDMRIAEINRNVLQNDLSLNLLQVGADLRTLGVTSERLKGDYLLSKELLSFENENYLNLALQYQEGKVTFLDLITSLNNLLDAKIQFMTSYFRALQNLAQYQYYKGTLSDHFN